MSSPVSPPPPSKIRLEEHWIWWRSCIRTWRHPPRSSIGSATDQARCRKICHGWRLPLDPPYPATLAATARTPSPLAVTNIEPPLPGRHRLLGRDENGIDIFRSYSRPNLFRGAQICPYLSPNIQHPIPYLYSNT